MSFTFIVVTFVILGILLFVAALFIKSAKTDDVEEILPYRLKKYFFSKSEQQFFRILEEQINSKQYSVFAKVRLGDFVEVDAPKGERMSNWNRIKSKHVDFLIYNIQTDSIAAAIELDGKSHEGNGMQKSDDFKDKLYPVIGVTLTRIKVGSDFSQEINNLLRELG